MLNNNGGPFLITSRQAQRTHLLSVRG